MTAPTPDSARSLAARTAATRPVAERVVAWAREVRRLARGIVGSDAYDRYLAHHRVSGFAHAPMTEREFWRAKYSGQDRSPEGRCC